jgi:hypothetical protein
MELCLTLNSLEYDPPTRSWSIELEGSGGEVLGTGIVTNPFTDGQEEDLRWYLHKFAIKEPFARRRAATVAKSLLRYKNVISHCLEPLLHHALNSLKPEASPEVIVLRISEPSINAPSIQSLHWELLEDQKSWKEIAVPVLFARKISAPAGLNPKTTNLPSLNSDNVINILVVSARPGGRKDHPYRLISQPLWDLVHSDKDLVSRINIHFVRPGTWTAFRNAILNRDMGLGFFSIVHFDTHGIVDKNGR